MASFDAEHAWDLGYHYAVRGICRVAPRGTWIVKFSADFLAGYDQAVSDQRWGTHQ